jgi:hypothetical protein
MRTHIEWHCTRCAKQFALNAQQAARVRKDGKARVFCSRLCAGIAPSIGVCANCDVEFHPTQAARKRIREGGPAYCSMACYQAARVNVDCAFCANTYVTTAWQRRKIKAGTPPMCPSCRSESTAKEDSDEHAAVAG